jgi:hypothetical protein
MTDGAGGKVTNREFFATVFLKAIPLLAMVGLSLICGRNFLEAHDVTVPPRAFNAILFLSLLVVVRFTAWDMLRRLATESYRSDNNE